MLPPAREMPVLHRLVAGLALVGILIPFFVAFGAEWVHRDDLAVPRADLALIESATFAASRFERTLGPYSQFRFSHPGPVMFYGLAPFYRLAGMHSIGLHLGALAFAVAALCVVAAAFARDALASPPRVLFAATVLVLAFVGLARDFVLGIAFTSPWNPAIAAFALLATAAASSSARAGDDRFLPIAVVAHAFASQSHTTAALAATLMLVLAFASPVARARRRSVSRLALGLAVVLWTPTLLDALLHRGGNLADIARFVLDDPRRASGKLDLEQIARALGWPLEGLARLFGRRVHADVVALGLWILGLLVLAIDRRRVAAGSGDVATLARLDVALVGLVFALTVVPLLRGHSVPYLAYGIGIASTHLHVVLAFSIRCEHATPRATLVAALAFVVALDFASRVALETRETSLTWFGEQRPAAAAIDAIGRCLARRGDVAIRFHGRPGWVFGATAALAVLEEGRVPELHPAERFRSGEPFEYARAGHVGPRVRFVIDTTPGVDASNGRRVEGATVRIVTRGLDAPSETRVRECLNAR